MAKSKNSCRVCASKALTPITVSQRWGDTTSKISDINSAESGFILCDPSVDAKACGLLQRSFKPKKSKLTENTSPVPSGTFRSVRDHLRAAATEALELISGRDCAALDIGCNDGTLLSYYPKWVDRFGVDIDDSIDTIGEWAWTAQAQFPSTDLDTAFGSKGFDIITCISTLEYVENPASLFEAVKKRLVNDGVFVLETLYAPMIITSNNFEALTTEVTGLYSINVLEQLLRKSDLKIFRGTLTSKDGGSIRLFITHEDNNEYDFEPWSDRLAKLWDEETVLALRDRAPYQAFQGRCADARREFQSLLTDIHKAAENIHLLGADTHASELLKWAGDAGKAISYIASFHNPNASDDFYSTVNGRKIPIISETESKTMEPDFLLAPVRLKREVLENWREPILAGGRVIFASPTPHIVDANNYSAEYGKTLSQGDSAAGVETLRNILHAAGGPRLATQSDPKIAKSA